MSDHFMPTISEGNPGESLEMEVAFTNSEKSWMEGFEFRKQFITMRTVP